MIDCQVVVGVALLVQVDGAVELFEVDDARQGGRVVPVDDVSLWFVRPKPV